MVTTSDELVRTLLTSRLSLRACHDPFVQLMQMGDRRPRMIAHSIVLQKADEASDNDWKNLEEYLSRMDPYFSLIVQLGRLYGNPDEASLDARAGVILALVRDFPEGEIHQLPQAPLDRVSMHEYRARAELIWHEHRSRSPQSIPILENLVKFYESCDPIRARTYALELQELQPESHLAKKVLSSMDGGIVRLCVETDTVQAYAGRRLLLLGTQTAYCPEDTADILLSCLTSRAQLLLTIAVESAHSSGAVTVDGRHLLVAMTQVDGIAGKVLGDLGIKKEDIATTSVDVKRDVNLPLEFSEEIVRIINVAKDIVAQLDHLYIGSEHLLLGIALSDSIPLAAFNVSTIKARVLEILGEPVDRI